MKIKEIVLNNFRIYKGINSINLMPEENKNVIVVSGNNGFGKTTFLMSLVWCLYGKQMQDVDELYKKEITEQGGYTKYIAKSLNNSAMAEGETDFAVRVVFVDVNIPEIQCKEIQITRTYSTVSNNDRLEILIDGYKNELIQELTTEGKKDAEEIFIREFLLPIEIAKFFFFDAEKIVSIGDISSSEQRQKLSRAYTEVLGIKKYEDLKGQIEVLQDDYRRNSAKPEELRKFNSIKTEIENKKLEIDEYNDRIETLEEEKEDKRSASNNLQMKLIKEGNQMSLEQIGHYKDQETKLDKTLKDIQENLRDLYDLVPFGLSGGLLMDIAEQLKKETNIKRNQYRQEDVSSKTSNIINDIEEARQQSGQTIRYEISSFYIEQIKKLVKKYFYSDVPEVDPNEVTLHDFTDEQTNTFNDLIKNLKQSFKSEFTKLSNEYQIKKNEYDQVHRLILNAEKNAEDEHIAALRKEKEELDANINAIESEIKDLYGKVSVARNDLKSLKQRQEELRKKIDESSKYTDKERKTKQIIDQLKSFIVSFKQEKKRKLEANILEELSLLMHKKNFVKRVEVDINSNNDDVDISLYRDNNVKLGKTSLSMGERQLFSSALLKSLIDESDIEFPVFIDSPMQKFDGQHAKSVITEYYPNVSKQVILFPLLLKELTAEEYELLKPKVCKAYLIQNETNEASHFTDVAPDELINKYKNLYAN